MNTIIKSTLSALACSALLAASSPARAQVYSIPWSTFDGGGGAAAGGAFSLHGTVGQPDAGAPLSGGMFTLSGGFWPGVPGTSSGPVPALAIRLGTLMAGANTVILTWPHPSTGYVLQQTANMSGPGGGWTDVTQPPVITGPNQEVTLPATGQSCMFRLRRL